MIIDKKDLILSVINNTPLRKGKITDEEFLRKFLNGPANINEAISRELNNSLVTKDPVSLELAMYLGFHFEFSENDVNTLASLMTENWHEKHADVLRALVGLKSHSSEVVDAIYHCAITDFDYLEDDREDGIFTLASDCIYALAKIGTPCAIDKLKLLMESRWEEVREQVDNVMRNYDLK
ncbi:hypothetical protein [Enterobacter sp. Bisph1]|uniref:hypothetical protein n=1 Tax=Enterobacter sp. Bisph1 TaxID=1274399 RepID=UPI00057C1414|nr:hypothetical protein [Enterobacter sp. Bisph1]